MSDPIFLGFSAFETTAFCTSMLVAWYSLIPNPSGQQSAFDSAEYQIFAGWRLALLAILGQVILMTVVLIQQNANPSIESKTTLWLLLLMIAPWAPVAGKVRDTLTSGHRVRRMMKRRLARNEMVAIMRDRFKFGQRSIAMPSIIYYACGILPRFPRQALLQTQELEPFYTALKHEAMMAAQLDEDNSLELGALWAMNQSLQPSSLSKARLLVWKIVSSIDLLSRVWTGRSCHINVDVMPDISLAHKVERARYLDIVDLLQRGGTLSDDLVRRGLKRFCHRCTLATRCAVEIFLESSERGHTDLGAGEWLMNVGMDWAGSFERVIDVMWEACFMDSKALRVQGKEKDGSPDFNDRSKVTTTKMLALLFVISRSIVCVKEDHMIFNYICGIVDEGPFKIEWWSRYWRRVYDGIRAKNGGLTIIDSNSRKVFKDCLRGMVDEDMFKIVQFLLKSKVENNMCGESNCFLHSARLVLDKYQTKSST